MDISHAILAARKQNALALFTVYDHPSDIPAAFVVRMSFSSPDPKMCGHTGEAWTFDTLDRLRETLGGFGLVRILRDPTDDPVIVETWV